MGATHLLFHNQGRGRPVGGITPFPTWIFNPSLGTYTFTPKADKRVSGGPFGVGVMAQGKLDTTGTGDLVYAARGSQISGNFYTIFDTNQFTIAFWITPEWDGDDGLEHTLISQWPIWIVKKADSMLQAFYWDNGGTFHYVSVDVSAWSAGTKYFVAYSFDVNNDIDGTNFGRLSINDVHTFGISATPNGSRAPSNAFYLANGGISYTNPDAILEGVTMWRRVLSDGTNGISATSGQDDLNLIYNAGSGTKPEEVCPEDIVFQVSTNGTAEELSTGTGEAWSFPWGDNELTNWHMQNGTAGAPDNWNNQGTPTLADAATADILFGTRAQKITLTAGGHGIYQDKSVSAGENYKISVWAKVSTGLWYATVYDVTNAAYILSAGNGPQGSSTSYTYDESCFEIPAGCNTIRVLVISSGVSDIHLQQVMVHPNLVDNGGFEGTFVDAGAGGHLMCAPGWTQIGCDDDGSDILASSADAHSGSTSQHINVSAAAKGVWHSAGFLPTNKWCLLKIWIKGTSGNVAIIDSSGGDINEVITSPAATWTEYSFLFFSTGLYDIIVRSSGGAANFRTDDLSVIVLDDVSLTVTPASEANSLEPSPSLRVDGRDTLTDTIVGITATSGDVSFNWTPRHDAAEMCDYGVPSNWPFVCYAFGNVSNLFYIWFASGTSMRLTFNADGAGAQTGIWNPSGALVAGTTYKVTIRWTANEMKMLIDDVVKITITQPVNFTTLPDTLYFGSASGGYGQVDAVFG